MKIYCCECEKEVDAEFVLGSEIYPHRLDLHILNFYKCNICNNYVGTHKNSKNKIMPLGNIPTPEIRKIRIQIHRLIDPVFKSGKISRKDIYQKISSFVGWEYHTAKIRSVDEALKIISFLGAYLTEVDKK